MISERDVVVLVGSLRRASINLRLAKVLQAIAPTRLTLDIVPIGDLPLYNQDLDTEKPPSAWAAFRDRVRRSDAVLFVTPEYNRSLPAALKNALEVGSRPYGKSVWENKPGAVTGASPGLLGGSAAALHLRQILVSVNVAVLPQPEVYLSSADKFIDEAGLISSDATNAFLGNFLDAFGAWVDKLA
ncbi:NADPH-dependent FMN reductase [Sinorhizobium americanum]|uniref:NADPH-dependent FMN reductase n=1 Tax=Sinorhizobium americanum TaxID=194963 RepID=UPI0007DA1749|nr:NAD(P)H-dependent oxidoreductase [Sinorhizobium americanum]OAP50124.1 ACP phosphodiesterase [Sinorhizobium americanum]